jgi:hypothetical protein
MKIAAVCCTYLRPIELGHLVRCFQYQDYPDRELVILDDAGQYENCQGDRWRLIAAATRFATLGEKRNAAAWLVSPDVDALAVWDDDDLYLPWALSASVSALRRAPWSRPSLVLHPAPDGGLRQHRTGGLFHGGWAYRRDVFWHCGGYPPCDNGEDRQLAARLARAHVGQADPVRLGFPPFYVFRWNGGQHLSCMGTDGYQRLGTLRGRRTTLVPADPPDVELHNPRILPGIYRRTF